MYLLPGILFKSRGEYKHDRAGSQAIRVFAIYSTFFWDFAAKSARIISAADCRRCKEENIRQ
jgi:hypothetical protein